MSSYSIEYRYFSEVKVYLHSYYHAHFQFNIIAKLLLSIYYATNGI